MVWNAIPKTSISWILSVLALSSRFDGHPNGSMNPLADILSVLALSSRFDGRLPLRFSQSFLLLSVLALSSRFDGRSRTRRSRRHVRFQYSLCRVVLMVLV